MNGDDDLWDKLTQIALDDPTYNREAYLFVLNGLNWSFRQLGHRRHLSGQELTECLVAFAQEEFGGLADCVLKEWGIFATRDLGEIVYNLIDEGMMSKEPNDAIEDFDKVLDLEEAVTNPDFTPKLLK